MVTVWAKSAEGKECVFYEAIIRDRDPDGADKDPGKVVLELKPEQSVGVLARKGPVGSGQWGGGGQVRGMGREGGSERRPVR